MFANRHFSLSKLITFAVGLVGVLLLAYALNSWALIVWSPTTALSLLVIPVLLTATAGWLLLKGGDGTRANFVISIVGLIFALYIGELLLIAAGPYITLPRSYDRRTTLEVVMEMRQAQAEVFPSVHPKQIISSELVIKGTPILPLSGIPEVTTVFCNETGEYYIYQADEYGFTNPRGSFAEPAEILLIGDSFAQGFCSPGGRSFAELIRQAIPRTVNIGSNGNGPLVELAGLREYQPTLSPRYVFWFYFEGNDIEDLSREIEHPILRRYLDEPGFSQALSTKVPEYNQALRGLVEERYSNELAISARERMFARVPQQFNLWIKLWHTRALMGLTDFKRTWPIRYPGTSRDEAILADAFDSIMSSASLRTREGGAELVFVYLPSFRGFGYQIDHPWRARVLATVAKHEIPIIDMRKEFLRLPDPIGMFNFRKEAHYTDAGNALVAKLVLQYLALRGESVPNRTPGL